MAVLFMGRWGREGREGGSGRERGWDSACT